MTLFKTKKAKYSVMAGSVIFFVAFLFFLLRGPYLSNYTKRLIIPVLENATQERVIIDSAVINLFPFYFQAKGLKMFDKEGNQLLWITKSRVYMDLPALLARDIRIRKLMVIEPDVTAEMSDLKRILENFRKTSQGTGTKFSFSLRNIDLTGGRFRVEDPEGFSFSGDGLSFDMNTKRNIIAAIDLRECSVKRAGFPGIRGSVRGRMSVEGDRLRIADVDISSEGSRLKARGMMNLNAKGMPVDGKVTGKAEVNEEFLHTILGISSKKDTKLAVDGTVQVAFEGEERKPRFTVDLDTDSTFYLESLMEILEVATRVTGKVSVRGKITGTFPDISGSGTAELADADFGTLEIDSAKGNVSYGDRKFSLSQITAKMYKGEIKGDAYLLLPHADYSVTASASGLGSVEFFRYLNWDSPFPAGTLSGRFHLTHVHDRDIDITADASYVNTTEKSGNMIGRLDTVGSGIRFRDRILWLDNAVLSTGKSSVSLDGSIDFSKDLLDLQVLLDSGDMSDLASPYYRGLSGTAAFKGRAKGPVRSPEITGSVSAGPGAVQGIPFQSASGDLVYNTQSLNLSRLRISGGKSSYDVSGTIGFRGAEGLFSFGDPYFRGRAAVHDAGLKPFVTAFYKDIPVSATVNGTVSVEGGTKDFTAKGDFQLTDCDLYGQAFDKVTGSVSVQPKSIEFTDVNAKKGQSSLDAKGKVFFDGRFNASLESERVLLSDVMMLKRVPVNAAFKVKAGGTGTFEKPDISFSAEMPESAFRNIKTGWGRVEGTLRGKDLSAQGTFLNGLVTALVKGVVSEKLKWNADLDIRRGNYDFLLGGFLRDIPEDTLLTLEGKTRMEGDGGTLSLESRFSTVYCTLFGYNLRNVGDVLFELRDGKYTIRSFTLSSDYAGLSASGSLRPYEEYDLKFQGRLSMTSLKNLSEKFASLRGEGDFSVDITGPWNKPDVTGAVNVKDTIASLTVYPYKIGPVTGTVFFQKDRFTFDSLHLDLGGGSVLLSGVGYLSGLSVKQFFVSSVISDVTVKPAERFSLTSDGRLFYELSEKGSAISGNINISRARYEKDVVWNKWLIDLRKMSKEPVRYPAFLKDTKLNVYITGADNIIIDNNIAKTPVKIDVVLTGDISRPGLVGRMEAAEGSIFFRSNEFKILEGSNVDFTDPGKVTPVFHVLAETYTGNYYIKLNLDGTTDKFSLSLFSDPPLTEMEILNLLTFGQAQRDSKGLESGIAASEAASILTGGIQDVVQEGFKSITGFERFAVEPHTTAAGAVSPKVTIGKRLLEDKLYVIYSSSIGTTEENILSLEYRVDRNISLVGSRDEIGSVGGDVKFRFEFK